MRTRHLTSLRTRCTPLAAALLAGLGLSANAMAAFQVSVTTSGDAGNNGTCTLRQAITTLNNGSAVNTACVPSSISGANDTIVFNTTTFPLNGANVITLADAANNQLSITDANLTIDASANGNVTVQRSATATNAFGIIYFYDPGKAGALTVRNLTIANGKLTAAQPSTVASGAGIASVYGSLTVIDSVVTGNSIACSCYAIGGGIGVYAGNLTLTNSSVGNNSVSGSSGASGMGGGVFVRQDISTQVGGSATIAGSLISGNTAKGNGGGLHVGGTLTMSVSSVTGNTASNTGGGMKIYGVTTLTNSTVSGNSASNNGGGICAASGYYGVPPALLTLNGSTLASNKATGGAGGRGGGIFSRYGNLSFINSTIAANSSAFYGGGIYVRNNTLPITLTQSTLAGNTAVNRGGGLMINTSGSGIVTFNGNVVANSIAPSSGGGNIGVGTGGITIAGSGNLVFGAGLINAAFSMVPLSGDPKLTPLGNFGGPTRTMIPMVGSAAIDAIAVVSGQCPLPTDQRGISRPQSAGCDIGAVEYDGDLIFADGFGAP